jgi:hypothetical protein
MKSIPVCLLACLLFASCIASRERKSGKYYVQHEAEIQQMLSLYRQLYRHQPFTIGFSNRDFRYVGVDIITDTVRYAINNEESLELFREAITGFHYDTSALFTLYRKMYAIKCIWMGTADLFYDGREEIATFLSFRSVLLGNPFLDRKYYNLVIFDPAFINPRTDSLIRQQGFTRIKDEVYFKIMGRFR